MALPAGVTTATVIAGVPVTHTGAPVKAFVSIEPSAYLVHAATGTPLVDFLEELDISEGTAGQFILPHTDQSGFIDSSGNAYTNWYYTARVTYSTPSKAKTKAPKVKVFQLTTGQSTIDLDLLPEGAPALPYIAPTATVNAFMGRTGAITLEESDLPERLSETELSATYAPTAGSPNYRPFTDGGYLMACFRAASGALGGDQVLSLLYSKDGKTFYDGSYAPQYSPTTPKVVRDPSIIYRNGVFYICHTNTGTSGTSFDIITSTDLYNWTLATTVDVSGIGGVTATWAPEFQIDTNGDVYIFVTINETNPYWLKATNAGLTTWTAPTLLTITGRPTKVIDPVFVKKGNLWYCFYKREDTDAANRLIYRATSSTLTGTYTTDKTGDWAGWGSNLEGPQIVTLHDGTYRIYLDEPNNTTDLFSYFYSDSTDLETWTAKVPVGRFPGDVPMKIRHGSVLPLSAEAGMKAANLGIPQTSSRAVGKLNNQNQTAAPGIYTGYGTNGATKYPNVIWANGAVAIRSELDTSGRLVFDKPGVANSGFLRIGSGVLEVGNAGAWGLPIAKKKVIECSSNVSFTSTTYADFSNVTGSFTPTGTKVVVTISGVVSSSGSGSLDTTFQVVASGGATATVVMHGGVSGTDGSRRPIGALVAVFTGLTPWTAVTFTLQAQLSAAGTVYCRPQTIPTEALTMTLEDCQ